MWSTPWSRTTAGGCGRCWPRRWNAVPLGRAGQPRESGPPGAHRPFVLERKEHPFVFRLLAGEHGGVLAGADRDIAGRLGGAGQREQGPEANAAPALAEPAPALAAVEVRDQLGVHQGAQFFQGETSGPLDLAADGKRGAASHWLSDFTTGLEARPWSCRRSRATRCPQTLRPDDHEGNGQMPTMYAARCPRTYADLRRRGQAG